MPAATDILQKKMSEASLRKLAALKNEKVNAFLEQFASHCDPKSIFVCDDSPEDAAYLRKMALEKGEERPMALAHQTIHWDGYGDQGRDKRATRYLARPDDLEKMKSLSAIPYAEGLAEIMAIARGAMAGKDAVVKFFAEGPTESLFTVPCVQFTDSFYVAHSETILYRPAYNHFLRMKEGEKGAFFRFVHSAGRLDDRGASVDLDKRRVYIDTQDNIVYSMNTQYAGNSVGLKKLSMRLAINKSGQEGWLCEHMFLMAVPGKGRKTYFAGAYPSACGKTSTAMIPGELIVGDDIAYFRGIRGEFRGVNVEQGIFGIIKDVNAQDDPVIFQNLMKDQETIFSNILQGPDQKPYWVGSGLKTPEQGTNHHGSWKKGDRDEEGKEVPLAHGNARYTIRLDYLDNFDKEGFEAKEGVKVQGVLYGGRDSDTTVPVEESPSWKDGILLKACTLESETTSATLGQEGVRTPSPMANLDFVSYPLGQYVMNNLRFADGIKDVPRVFSNNYFMRGPDGKFMTGKLAKKVWLHWAEGRIHGGFEAHETPTGRIPLYADLQRFFKDLLKEDFKKPDYDYLFTFRCSKWIEKLDRTAAFFRKMDPATPAEVFAYWAEAKGRIAGAQSRFGDSILPGVYKA